MTNYKLILTTTIMISLSLFNIREVNAEQKTVTDTQEIENNSEIESVKVEEEQLLERLISVLTESLNEREFDIFLELLNETEVNSTNFTKGLIRHETEDFSSALEIYKELLENHASNEPEEKLLQLFITIASEQNTLSEYNYESRLTSTSVENEPINEKGEEPSQDSKEQEIDIIRYQTKALSADELYTKIMTEYGASKAWEFAIEFETQYPSDDRVVEVLNYTADRLLKLGKSNHRSGNYSSAIVYYNMIITGKSINVDTLNKVEIYHRQAINNEKLSTADDMYGEAMTAYGASQAWEAAQRLKREFPSDSRINQAINVAAERLFMLGTNNHRSGNYSSAMVYYQMITDESLVNDNLLAETKVYYAQAMNNEKMSTAEDMYEEAMTAYGATEAWEAAQNLKKVFPSDTRISETINTAAKRLLILGTNNHRSGNYSSAMVYYQMITDESIVNDNLLAETKVYYAQAMNNEVLSTADDMYGEAMNAYGASQAWDAAQKLKRNFPSDSRISKAINTAAKRLLILGTNNHRSGNYSSAMVYYQMITDESIVNDNLLAETKVYYAQAMNNEVLSTADDMYGEAMNAYGASQAWDAAQKLKRNFPSDSRISKAIDSAAGRLLTLGVNKHKSGNYSSALIYYQMIGNEEAVNPIINDTILSISDLARKSIALYTPAEYYNKSTNSYGASNAWKYAQQGLMVYPNNPRIKKSLDEAANRYLTLGRNQHMNGNISTARFYYNSVLNEKYVSQSLKTLGTVFLRQLSSSHKPIVYLDAGHGGKDPGAVHNGLNEKLLNLNTSQYLKEELETRGYTVVMSRNTDIFLELTERANDANNIFADIFVSVHYNSMGGSGAARGIETFIHHTVSSGFGQEANRSNFKTEDIRIKESLNLADSIHSNLIRSTGLFDRGVKGNNFNVLRNTNVPAVLLELGFMDNSTELARIRTKSYQKTTANAIANGIDNYFSGL